MHHPSFPVLAPRFLSSPPHFLYAAMAHQGVVGNDTCYGKAIAACGNGMKWDLAMEVFNVAGSHGVVRGPVSPANTSRRGARMLKFGVYYIWCYCCTECVTCCVCIVCVTCKPYDTITRGLITGTGSISTLCSTKNMEHSYTVRSNLVAVQIDTRRIGKRSKLLSMGVQQWKLCGGAFVSSR